MTLKVSSLSLPISAGTSQDCLQRIVLFRSIYELVSGEDGSLHVAWRSGKVFRKADSLINLARDAVKADVKKNQQYTYILDAIQHLANDVDALGDESKQECVQQRCRHHTNATFSNTSLIRCTLSGDFTFYIISFL